MDALEAKIGMVEQNIAEVEATIASLGADLILDDGRLNYLRVEKSQLRDKERQLREEKLLLLQQAQAVAAVPGNALERLERLELENERLKQEQDRLTNKVNVNGLLMGECFTLSDRASTLSENEKQIVQERAIAAADGAYGVEEASTCGTRMRLDMVTGSLFPAEMVVLAHLTPCRWWRKRGRRTLMQLLTGLDNPDDPKQTSRMLKPWEVTYDHGLWTLISVGPGLFQVKILCPAMRPLRLWDVMVNGSKLLSEKDSTKLLKGASLLLTPLPKGFKAWTFGQFDGQLLTFKQGYAARPSRQAVNMHFTAAVRAAEDKGWIDKGSVRLGRDAWSDGGASREAIQDWLDSSDTQGLVFFSPSIQEGAVEEEEEEDDDRAVTNRFALLGDGDNDEEGEP